ncbi:flagellar export protein FliJ [Clostridium sp. 19966]|uniref:flagellar export protein FliJ n=1 Tax=Clostridium sp. 19966 TaxID=2768166 RepID=UPI0028E01F22|nr:flagellar export protein FliJ [Clostridium sp. 19966]MDT8716653.1 flagellar export protein FliJ [Clostridium sp. 19966]
MDNFKFPLEKLLDIRKSNEEKSKRIFLEASRQKKLVEDKILNLQENYDQYKVIDQTKSVVERKIANNYLLLMESCIDKAKEELIQHEKNVEKTRDELKAKQIERKTVEILKQKKYDEFKKEQDRLEQIQNDEFALYSYIRAHGKEVK